MHIHILGVCGTFMGGVAQLAKALGYSVSGQDANVYPPMSTQLEQAGIELVEGFDPRGIPKGTDLVVIGNALSRGNGAVEHVLNQGLPYTSGAQWLSEYVLHPLHEEGSRIRRWVLAVAGTHGKTTTAGMLAWILEQADIKPGFLIGGVPENFGISARLGASPFFVVEADEYDTAFFDKRSKFVHYRPRTTILNNLEFDHADIFASLADIQRQFHHLIRTVPSSGLVVAPMNDDAVNEVLEMGCWSSVERVGGDCEQGWSARPIKSDGSSFEVCWNGRDRGRVEWSLLGRHNMMNALAAIAAARHAGVVPEQAIESLCSFKSVKRRMEVRGQVAGVTVYDDFAHHPTAIATTLQGLRERVGKERILAVLEPRSNTMRMGVHKDSLLPSLQGADKSYVLLPADLSWQLDLSSYPNVEVFTSVKALMKAVLAEVREQDHILVMSNGGFENIHNRLLESLSGLAASA